MSAGQGPTFPGAGQGNWWERANYGGQGQAPAAPGGAAGMVTGYPGSTQWFGSQQAQFPNTAPGGTDWLRNMQQLQQYYGGGLGYGQQGGLAAPSLGQQQGGLYGTGNSGWLTPGGAAPTGQGGTTGFDPLRGLGQQLPAGYTTTPLAQAPADQQRAATGYDQPNAPPSYQASGRTAGDGASTNTGVGFDAVTGRALTPEQGGTTGAPGQATARDTGPTYNQQNTPEQLAAFNTTGRDVPWATLAQGMDENARRNATTTPGGTTTPPATTPTAPEPPANVAMQNGRPPTSQVTTAAQLATANTAAPSTAAPEATTANVTIGGGSGATGAGPVRQINDALVKAYYTNRNPGAFWQQAGQILAGGDRQFENYFVQNFDRYMAQYLQAAESDQNLQLSDWLTGAAGESIRRDYLMQAPEQRGLDYRRTDPGRFDMRY